MSKVITFSRVFPSYHPRAGEPTLFLEKILKSLWSDDQTIRAYFMHYMDSTKSILNIDKVGKVDAKHHTIRAGHRFKAGDWFSPRVWSGKPYNSKQIQFAPDIQIKKVWDFSHDEWKWVLPGITTVETIAANDGLSMVDFLDWFQLGKAKKFEGQIICWNESIEY